MAKVHGKDTYISVDGDDLSQFCNSHEWNLTVDQHDTTCYGADAHDYDGGLLDGTATAGGIYDNTANTSPRHVLPPLRGTKVTLIRRPEGTGSGKPQDSVTVLVGEYTESSPVADMVTWTCSFQMTNTVTTTSQGA